MKIKLCKLSGCIAKSILAVTFLFTLQACSSSSNSPSSTTPESIVPGPELIDLDAFQVIAIPLLDNNELIPVDARPASLVADRAAVLRAKVVVPDDWTPAEIELRIDVTSGGESTTYRSTALIDKSSNLTDPNDGILVELPSNVMQPDATYVASLWTSGASLPSARHPQSGKLSLSPVVTGPVKVHIVPYKIGDLVPDTSQAALDDFRDAGFALYPTNKVDRHNSGTW